MCGDYSFCWFSSASASWPGAEPYSEVTFPPASVLRTSACHLPAGELRATAPILRLTSQAVAAPRDQAAPAAAAALRRSGPSCSEWSLPAPDSTPRSWPQRAARTCARSPGPAATHSAAPPAPSAPSSAGASLDATLISPFAPIPIAASARLSSPQKTLNPRGTE